MEVYLERVELGPLLRDVVTIIGPLVEKNSNRLSVSVADDLGAIDADVTKLRQALLNLLSNACKFTQEGRVELEARRERRGDGEVVLISVADSGIGMSEEQLSRLFQPFVQADASTTRRFGGTGLGLAITRRFCQMMGGDVEVASVDGKGSRFTIVLPAPPPA
jgi:signal transduction histidine kinase